MSKFSSISPSQLKLLAKEQLSTLIISEVGRSRARIAELKRVYPSAGINELAERLCDAKKSMASTSGALSGVFGMLSVPLDMTLIAYLQLSVMIDVACLYKINMKDEQAQRELLDLLQYVNGINPVVRASPRVLGHVAFWALKSGGLKRFGRAIPVLASPLTAWMNNKAIMSACHEAIVFYGQDKKTSEGDASENCSGDNASEPQA